MKKTDLRNLPVIQTHSNKALHSILIAALSWCACCGQIITLCCPTEATFKQVEWLESLFDMLDCQ